MTQDLFHIYTSDGVYVTSGLIYDIGVSAIKKTAKQIYNTTSTKKEFDKHYQTVLVYAMYRIGFILNLTVMQ